MYLIQCIRFGSWKVRRLNRALGLFADGKTNYPTILYSSTSEIPTSFPGSLSGWWNPYSFIYQKPGKGTPFGRKLPVWAIIGSSPRGRKVSSILGKLRLAWLKRVCSQSYPVKETKAILRWYKQAPVYRYNVLPVRWRSFLFIGLHIGSRKSREASHSRWK